ncbi:TonB-dependent receptor domain-containing protein [Brevundimonas sp.]|uniref:TonB-dependent receptor n=1 Tax=Brevundimonas sp. TaxID=1871086 RepID=UPI0028993CC8|nr:TonB-dependent receptor [Brevundimonas sp.]
MVPKRHVYASLGLMLSASALPLSGPAFAQEQSTTQLGEIVVTAQKRAQNLQEVPVAITALSAELVEQLAITDSRDISGMAPNVTIMQGTTSNSAAVISMRGISNGGSESFGLDSANGLYVDGVYIGRSGAAALDVMDIERIEVLRGPQGTLFGRNTTGGAIAFISRAPSDEFRAKLEAGYGNYNAWNVRASIDPGEIAGFATSFSYNHSQRDGVVDNILQADDSKDPGARKSDSFRAAVRRDFGDTASIQYIFDYSKVDGITPAFQLTHAGDGTPRKPILIDGQQIVITQPAPVLPYMAGITFTQPQCAALSAPTRSYRDKMCNDRPNTALDETWGHNLQIQKDFGAFQVKSTTGYRIWESSNDTDLDGLGTFNGPVFTQASLLNGLPAGLLAYIVPDTATANYLASQSVPRQTLSFFETMNEREHKQFSQELEIAGDTDTLDWVVGGFYFHEKGSEHNPQNSGYVLDTNGIFLGSFGALGPSLAAANPARYRAVITKSILAYEAESESKALYGQGTYYVGGRDGKLRLTAGGRYTWDKKEMHRTQNGAAPLAVVERGEASFDQFTWNLMAAYDVQEHVNVYARIASGYRSGGFNSQDPVIPGTSELASFNPETVISYEVGLKSELFDRRLRFNASAYHNIYTDLAVNIPRTDAPPGTFATRVGNAGEVTYTGFDIETQAILNDHFSLDANLGYVDIEYQEFMTGQSIVPGAAPINVASITEAGYTSPLTASVALNMEFPVSYGRVFGRLSYTYEDGKLSFNNSIGAPFNEELRGDDRNVVDAQLGINGLNFGNAEGEVRLWVKNLTDSHDFVRGVDFAALGLAGGYYADPRTFGITVSARF